MGRGRAAVVIGAGAGLAAGAMMLSASAPAPGPLPPEVAWAYPIPTPNTPPLNLGPGEHRTPDGKRVLTAEQIAKIDAPDMDWFPDSHPKPPTVVLSVWKDGGEQGPCAQCHTVSGRGGLGTPDLAGLRQSYLMEQVAAFRAGARTSSHPDYHGTQIMTEVAKAWSEEDLKAATAYFASLPRQTPIQVVEAESAPPIAIARHAWTYVDPQGGAAKPLNGAVAEAPDTLIGARLQDPAMHEIVYAPKGSIARGAEVAHSGGASGLPCAACHGEDYRGTEVAPPLAGRDPSYLTRQLWDIHTGARSGPSVALMQAPAKGLTPAQVRDVAVYLASLKP